MKKRGPCIPFDFFDPLFAVCQHLEYQQLNILKKVSLGCFRGRKCGVKKVNATRRETPTHINPLIA